MPKFLPGDLPKNKWLKRNLRVNHAGEYGAKRIYEGQIAVLGESEDGDTLRHMAEQEAVHLAYFDAALVERRVRPTLLHPLWHVAGFALGAGTALMGRKAAMACTVAVEETIDAHYAEQLEKLEDDEAEKDLRTAISRFRDEELEHRDIGLANDAEQAPAYPLLSRAIKTGCKAAIWLSKRV